MPFTILRSTQFFEFAGGIAQAGTDGDVVRLPDAQLQPVAADDVADTVAGLATSEPAHGTGSSWAAPRRCRSPTSCGATWPTAATSAKVVADPHARYFGTELSDGELVAGPGARRGKVTLAEWLQTPAAHR